MIARSKHLHILEYPELQSKPNSNKKETLGRKLWREKVGKAKSLLIRRYGINKVLEIIASTEKME